MGWALASPALLFPMPKPQEMSQRERQRELAEQIVKILRQNPANATSYEYDRLIEAIALYTLQARAEELK